MAAHRYIVPPTPQHPSLRTHFDKKMAREYYKEHGFWKWEEAPLDPNRELSRWDTADPSSWENPNEWWGPARDRTSEKDSWIDVNAAASEETISWIEVASPLAPNTNHNAATHREMAQVAATQPAANTPSRAQNSWANVAANGSRANGSRATAVPTTNGHKAATPKDLSPWKPQQKTSGNGPQNPAQSPAVQEPVNKAADKIQAQPATKQAWDTYKDPLAPSPKTEEQIQKEQEETALKKRVCEFMEGWPWQGEVPLKQITLGPYNFSTHPRALPVNPQIVCKMFQAFEKDPGVEVSIMAAIFTNHGASGNFFSLCQKSALILIDHLHMWDVHHAAYMDCEKYEPEVRTKIGRPLTQVCDTKPPRHIIAAPVRSWQPRPSYVEQVNSLNTMVLAVKNWSDVIQSLQLHRIPFLTVHHLALMIPAMTTLKALGVYKCQLIHVGDTFRLFDILRIDQTLGRENQVQLDFYPNFHLGPHTIHDYDDYHVGNYGTTWDNSGQETCLATWALVARIVPEARKLGLDFESDGVMFRKWVEDGPCWKAKEVFGAVAHPKNPKLMARFEELLAYRRKHQKFVHASRPFKHEAEFQKCLEKLISLAARADMGNPDHRGNSWRFTNRDAGTLIHEGWQWQVRSHTCTKCNTFLLGVFFHYLSIPREDNPEASGICRGCQIIHYLNNESDHFKPEKRRIIDRWLKTESDGGYNTTNSTKSRADFDRYEIVREAKLLDGQRAAEMTRSEDPYDREYDERQIPLGGEDKTKYGMFNRSQNIWEKDRFPKDIFDEISHPYLRHINGRKLR